MFGFDPHQVKAQIALLFRDHPHLLEEYWVFYEQLHPSVQRLSDDDKMETDSVIHSEEKSQRLEKAAFKKNLGNIRVIV